MTKGSANEETATFHRDYPGVDPMRVRYDRLIETWAELERARSVDGPSHVFGSEQEIDAAKVMLMADTQQQASFFEPDTLKTCLQRGIISETEALRLQTTLLRISREQELLQMREGRVLREHDRER